MLRITVFLAVLMFCQFASGQLNMTEYYKMPKLYEFDDFDQCLYGHPPKVQRTYCYVRSLIQPNSSSDTWKIIQKYSSDTKRFYRHDRINRGICMSDCKERMLKFDYEARMKYYKNKFVNNTGVEIDPNLFTNALQDRAKYHKFAAMCVNLDLKKRYELSAQTDIIYCQRNIDDPRDEVDSIDMAFVALCGLICTLTFISTTYDFYLKRRNLPHMCNREHYKKSIKGSFGSLLVSFSLPRNYFKLTSDSTSNLELSRDLRSINAIRCICMFGVLMAHSALAMSILPADNPNYIESKYFNIMTMILINGSNVLQAYFAITGYLISTQFVELKEKHKFSYSVLWKAIVYRYLRFTPVYAFMIFFHATWLMKLQTGPFWLNFSDAERSICRINSWSNLLYVNNFYTNNEPCIQHAWYLAADFQLVIVGTIIQMLIWRFPKKTKLILGTCIIFAVVIPTYATYINGLDGIFLATPENQRYAHWFDKNYKLIYIPFYTNFGSFLCGMIGGILYCHHKRNKIDLIRSKWLPVLWWGMIPISFGILLSGYIFFAYEFEKPAIWIGIYAAITKSIWGVFGATFVTGVALNTGWIIKDIFRHPMFRTMSRLTFGVYLIHPDIMRATLASQRHPIYASDIKIMEVLMSSYFLSYFLSFLMALFIEIPCSVLQKRLYQREKSAIEKNPPDVNVIESTKLSKNLNDNLEMKNKIVL